MRSGRASAHAHGRGADIPGPQGSCRRWTDPRPLERRAAVPERRHLRRNCHARLGLPASAPRRRQSTSPQPCPPRSRQLPRPRSMWDLLPTSRSSIGYRYDWTTYVIHPDASFTLEYKGRWRPYLLEFERRATTPKRARSRLKSYQPLLPDSGWAERDHEGRPPRVLFVFESPDNENAFLDVADTVKGVAHHHLQRRDPCRAWHPGRLMDSSASALPRQEAAVRDGSRWQNDRHAVPTTSCRGCPSMPCWDHCPPTCNRSFIFRPPDYKLVQN